MTFFKFVMTSFDIPFTIKKNIQALRKLILKYLYLFVYQVLKFIYKEDEYSIGNAKNRIWNKDMKHIMQTVMIKSFMKIYRIYG